MLMHLQEVYFSVKPENVTPTVLFPGPLPLRLNAKKQRKIFNESLFTCTAKGIKQTQELSLVVNFSGL